MRDTLPDRALWGTDQASSLSPVGLRNLMAMINKIPIIKGDGKKEFLEGEKAKSKELRYW